MSNFWAGFEKRAKISIKDVENALGLYLTNKDDELNARGQIDSLNSSRAGLHSPWLTGIPTLGIWPATSRANAIEEVGSNLLRSSPTVRAHTKELSQKERAQEALEHDREVALMSKHMAEEKNQSNQRMLGTATTAALLGLRQHYGSKDRDRDRD